MSTSALSQAANPYRDTYRFPVRPTGNIDYAYADVNGNDRFDSGVDVQIISARPNSSTSLLCRQLMEASAAGPISEFEDGRLSLNQLPPGIDLPVSSVTVQQGAEGLEAVVAFQKKSDLLSTAQGYRLDHDGDGQGDTALMMEFWLGPEHNVQEAASDLMNQIRHDMFFKEQAGPFTDSGPGPDQPRVFEAGDPFPMSGAGDVTRTFAYEPVSDNIAKPVVNYQFQRWNP